MLDSNVFDELVRDPDLLDACVTAISESRLLLVVTHIQADELAAIPNTDPRRGELLRDLQHATQTFTTGLVLDLSKWGLSSLFSDEDAERHRQYVGASRRRAKDALILPTADRERMPLVTMERKPSNLNRMRRFFPDVELWTLEDLRAAVAAPR
jgi:hypothetical protein